MVLPPTRLNARLASALHTMKRRLIPRPPVPRPAPTPPPARCRGTGRTSGSGPTSTFPKSRPTRRWPPSIRTCGPSCSAPRRGRSRSRSPSPGSRATTTRRRSSWPGGRPSTWRPARGDRFRHRARYYRQRRRRAPRPVGSRRAAARGRRADRRPAGAVCQDALAAVVLVPLVPVTGSAESAVPEHTELERDLRQLETTLRRARDRVQHVLRRAAAQAALGDAPQGRGAAPPLRPGLHPERRSTGSASSTLQSRFSTFAELWDRGLRAREEGRPGPFFKARPRAGGPAEAVSALRRAADRQVVGSATVSDLARESEKIEALYQSLVEARAGDRDRGAVPVPPVRADRQGPGREAPAGRAAARSRSASPSRTARWRSRPGRQDARREPEVRRGGQRARWVKAGAGEKKAPGGPGRPGCVGATP